MEIVFISLGIFTVFLIICILIGNSLVAKKNQVRNAEASVDAFLKKRYDLIPNLVETVKKYMKHERETLGALTEIRAKAVSLGLPMDEKARLDARLARFLGSIILTAEQYPELKASANFLQLQAALNEADEHIAAARRAYNAAVTEYNNALEMFPSSLFAALLRYKPKPLFAAADEEKANPNVKKIFES